jgi:hypothetical protein
MQTNVRGLRKEATMVVVLYLIVPLAGAEFAGGAGGPDEPYQIAAAGQLISLGSDPNLLDKHFVLIADIDLDPDAPGGRVFDRAVIAPMSETADPNRVGLEARFSGVFDGGGHTISNLTIRGGHYLGLFGQVSGVVKNLTIADADVSGSGNNIGCLAGSSKGNVTQCRSSGVVGGGSLVGGLIGRTIQGRIARCSSSAAVDAAGNSVGGLVGYSDVGRVDLCSSAGVVRGQSYVGGLIGWNYEGVVRHSYCTGAVNGSMDIGGLIGQNWTGCVTHCYSTGAVSGESTLGGLVGSNVNVGRSPGSVVGCFWDAESSGQAKSAAGVGKETAWMQDRSTFLNAGWDLAKETANGTSDYWQLSASDYPRLCWEGGEGPAMPEGAGTADEPYLIRSAADLGTVWLEPAACYRLETSVDLSGISWSVAVVPWFEGTFDGNGCVISNLRIRGGGYLGLFGETGSGARILNLGLEAIDVNGTGLYVGGLVGDNEADVSECYSSGTVVGDGHVGGLLGNNDGTVAACHSACDVTGWQYEIGGLIGSNSGRVATSFSVGTVSGRGQVGGLVGRCRLGGSIEESYSDSRVSGTDSDVGGLVGYFSGRILRSHSTGAVVGKALVGGLAGRNSGSVVSSYSTGAVEGEQLVGGLTGYNSGSIATSYSSGTVVGVLRVGGLAGLNGGNIADCYSRGDVRGDDYVGGLAGRNAGILVGSNIIGIVRSYSTGSVQGKQSVGGLVGVSGPSGTTASFWDVETSGQAASPIGAGKTTIEMLSAATYLDAGWDFLGEEINGAQSIWWIVEGQDYPRLWWELDEFQMGNEPGTGSTAILD